MKLTQEEIDIVRLLRSNRSEGDVNNPQDRILKSLKNNIASTIRLGTQSSNTQIRDESLKILEYIDSVGLGAITREEINKGLEFISEASEIDPLVFDNQLMDSLQIEVDLIKSNKSDKEIEEDVATSFRKSQSNVNGGPDEVQITNPNTGKVYLKNRHNGEIREYNP
jgi:hypothetical protein